MNRRTFLKTTLLTGGALPFGFNALAAEEKSSAPPRKFILGTPLTHSDWMLKPNIAWGEAGVRHMLDACKACGWSKIYWRVFDAGRATYKSKLLKPAGRGDEDQFWNPQSPADKALLKRYYPNVTAAQQKDIYTKANALDYTNFDTLAAAVDYGHKIGLQIHAWASINEDDHGWGYASEFTKKHPEFRWRKRDGTFYRSQLSFAFPEVRKYKLALVKELLAYNIDGLFLDWIRTGDVRDNPQTDADGVANSGYEEPLLKQFKRKYKLAATEVPNGDERWVRMRAEPQTEFMREVRKLTRKQKRKLPIAALVGHPWHYRGEINKIDGNLRGLLLDMTAWAREGLVDSVVAAGYYRDGGNPELATRALQKETEGKVDVWTYAWVPASVADAAQTFAVAEKVGAKEILFWEADYIDDRPNAVELKSYLSNRAERAGP